ncbi:MAG: hypothetical protein HN842_07190 [Gammaproteobacteria bacterium]|nr:hypothetical protein [Gammaproteobacteria bacterium]
MSRGPRRWSETPVRGEYTLGGPWVGGDGLGDDTECGGAQDQREENQEGSQVEGASQGQSPSPSLPARVCQGEGDGRQAQGHAGV